jgi:uncharacterized protein (DUF3820 family)
MQSAAVVFNPHYKYEQSIYRMMCKREFKFAIKPVSYTWKQYYYDLRDDFYQRIKLAYEDGCDWFYYNNDIVRVFFLLLLFGLYFILNQLRLIINEHSVINTCLKMITLILIMFRMKAIINIHMDFLTAEGRFLMDIPRRFLNRIWYQIICFPILGLTICMNYNTNIKWPLIGCILSGCSISVRYGHFNSYYIFFLLVTMISDFIISYILGIIDVYSNIYVYICILAFHYCNGLYPGPDLTYAGIFIQKIFGCANYIRVMLS